MKFSGMVICMKLDAKQKSIEAKVRRAGARRGIRIARSCARNPASEGYGLYWWGPAAERVPLCSVHGDDAFNLDIEYLRECLCGDTGEESKTSA